MWLESSMLPVAIITLLEQMSPWVLLATVASMVTLDQLCSQPPEVPAPFTVQDFAGAAIGAIDPTNTLALPLLNKVGAYVNYYAWTQNCECAPYPSVQGPCGPGQPGVTITVPANTEIDLPQFKTSLYCATDGAGNQWWQTDAIVNIGTSTWSPGLVSTPLEFRLGTLAETNTQPTGGRYSYYVHSAGAAPTQVTLFSTMIEPTSAIHLKLINSWTNDVTVNNLWVCDAQHNTPCTPPDSTLPPGTPPAPPLACDNATICNVLQVMLQMLVGLARNSNVALGDLNEIITMLQGWRTPYTSWYDGARHQGLSGSGRLQLGTNVVGVRLEFTTIPPLVRDSNGDPLFFWGLGFLTPLALDVPLRGWRTVFNPQSYQLPQVTDGIAWTLAPGAVMDLVELQPAT